MAHHSVMRANKFISPTPHFPRMSPLPGQIWTRSSYPVW